MSVSYSFTDQALTTVNDIVRKRSRLAQVACDRFAVQPTAGSLRDALRKLRDVEAAYKLRTFVENTLSRGSTNDADTVAAINRLLEPTGELWADNKEVVTTEPEAE